MRVHKGKLFVAGLAALTIGLTACSGSSSGGSGGSNGTGGSSGSGGSSSNSNGSTAGVKGTGNLSECSTSPNDCNSGTVKSGGTLRYVLEKTLPGWNTLYTPSNVFELAEVLDGVYPQAYLATPDLKPSLNTDLLTSATQTKASPQTIVYKINPDAVWSDGTPINFADFKYIADTQDGTTCPAAKCQPSSTAGYSQIKSLTGSDNGKTVTMVMKTPFSDWKYMFAPILPAHVASQYGNINTPAGLAASILKFNSTRPTVSGGPFVISAGNETTSITETPNPKWYGKIKSKLSSLIFRVITDQTQEPTALQNNEVDAIYPQPNQNLYQQVLSNQNVSTYLGKGLTWEHFDFNEKNQFLKNKALRTAMFTAINREQLIGRTIGTFVPNPSTDGNHIYVPGQAGYQDNVTSTGQGSGNVSAAKKILTQAGYTGVGSTLKDPSGKAVHFTCLYSAGNTDRSTECQIAQQAAKQLGATVTLRTTTDLHELGTGDFDMVVFAWVGTPFVVSGAQQIYELKGGADYGFNNDPAAEKLINQAARQTDASKVPTLMNAADKLIVADAYSLPLYQKPTFLAINNNLVNIRDNATSIGPPYNAQEWGQKSG